LEFTKPILTGTDEVAKSETRKTAAWVLEKICRALHPFIPFITEELWGQITNSDELLMLQQWPKVEAARNTTDLPAEAEMNWLMEAISQIRNVRAELNVPVAEKIQL